MQFRDQAQMQRMKTDIQWRAEGVARECEGPGHPGGGIQGGSFLLKKCM